MIFLDMSAVAQKKLFSAMQAEPLMMHFNNETQSVSEDSAGDYTSTEAIAIIALSSSAVFILMVIVVFVANEKNSKRLNKAMLVSMTVNPDLNCCKESYGLNDKQKAFALIFKT